MIGNHTSPKIKPQNRKHATAISLPVQFKKTVGRGMTSGEHARSSSSEMRGHYKDLQPIFHCHFTAILLPLGRKKGYKSVQNGNSRIFVIVGEVRSDGGLKRSSKIFRPVLYH
jgi:hypothetical protein